MPGVEFTVRISGLLLLQSLEFGGIRKRPINLTEGAAQVVSIMLVKERSKQCLKASQNLEKVNLGLMGTQQRPHPKLHATDAETFFDLLMRRWAAESMARRSSNRNHMNQGLDLSTGLDTESRCFARVVTNSVVVPLGELDISCCSQRYHFLQFQS